ncbi:DNA-directed RNA polymerase [Trifolium pratense]|uniref:DNA-directed RNA polymerase n=1 Tax=Trifolium pratense TaxID=57577 RepID=A0A2K3PNI6_TRIPR|nr:DNA-directed RNA polymerase [Trifolium pratense]
MGTGVECCEEKALLVELPVSIHGRSSSAIKICLVRCANLFPLFLQGAIRKMVVELETKSVSQVPGIGRENWFEENLRKVVGDGRDKNFWLDPWVDGESLKVQFSRLYDISIEKNRTVAEMISEEAGEKKVLWSWRRGLFKWEEEVAEWF